MNIILIYDNHTRETFENITFFQEKNVGISFRDAIGDYWFIKYDAFISFILSEVKENDT